MPEPIQTPQEGTEKVPPVATPPAEPAQPAPPAVDYEKKFKESQKENELLREAEAARRKAAEQDLTKEPTESELKAAFPSWDLYDEPQKEFAKRTFAAERTALNATQIARKLQDDQSWNTSIELSVSSDPRLQGKEQAFRQYASQPKYRNIPMEVLISAFLGEAAPAPAPRTTPKPGLEPGNGGPRTPDKPKLITSSELQALRKSDEKEYMKYIRTHDISQIEE